MMCQSFSTMDSATKELDHSPAPPELIAKAEALCASMTPSASGFDILMLK